MLLRTIKVLPVFGEPDYPEDAAQNCRFLDLRRETLHKEHHDACGSSTCRWVRSASTVAVPDRLQPEGARADFLVPEPHPSGEFFLSPRAFAASTSSS